MNDWDVFCLERRILKIGNLLSAKRDNDLRKIGITSSQSEGLLYLEDHPGISIIDLKKYLCISHQAARNCIERLKNKGFVRVEESPTDARSRSVYLTNPGEELCARLKAHGRLAGLELLAALSHDEKKQLDRLLKKIIS